MRANDPGDGGSGLAYEGALSVKTLQGACRVFVNDDLEAKYPPLPSGLPPDWVTLAMPPQRRSGMAWHYTDASGLVGIGTAQELWASSPASLNDTAELTYGAGVIRDVWSELVEWGVEPECERFVDRVLSVDLAAELQNSVFVLSASLDGDLLNQWQHYAGRGGYALGFDCSVDLQPDLSPSIGPEQTPPLQGWREVIYSPGAQRAYVRELLICIARCAPPELNGADMPTTGDVIAARVVLKTLISQLKHPAFAAEREVRWVAVRPLKARERFRAANGRVVPYLALSLRRSAADRTLPLRQLVIGPTHDQSAQSIAQRLLRQGGFAAPVDVVASRVPYRW